MPILADNKFSANWVRLQLTDRLFEVIRKSYCILHSFCKTFFVLSMLVKFWRDLTDNFNVLLFLQMFKQTVKKDIKKSLVAIQFYSMKSHIWLLNYPLNNLLYINFYCKALQYQIIQKCYQTCSKVFKLLSTGATREAGSADSSGAHEIIPSFWWRFVLHSR